LGDLLCTQVNSLRQPRIYPLSRMPTPAREHEVFVPGDKAPVSGIYLAVHDGHRAEHKITAIRGEEFPACRKCKSLVTFTLVNEADYVSHDWDFAGPGISLVK
jgi:hypothetical protein